MKLIRVAIQSFDNHRLSCRIQRSQMIRSLSTGPIPSNEADDKQSTNSSESVDDFEVRIFGDISGSNPDSGSFFEKLDKLEKAQYRSGWSFESSGRHSSQSLDGVDEGFNSLSDGMDGKLKKHAQYFEFNHDEVEQDNFAFIPDTARRNALSDQLKELDLTKPSGRRFDKKLDFEVTTEEVLRKADFRNVRFLANFMTEAGIIIKRSMTGISAKAQRKVAREIKTARAFGLLPFTTMGTKSFAFGRTMAELDEDFEFHRAVKPEETQDLEEED